MAFVSNFFFCAFDSLSWPSSSEHLHKPPSPLTCYKCFVWICLQLAKGWVRWKKKDCQGNRSRRSFSYFVKKIHQSAFPAAMGPIWSNILLKIENEILGFKQARIKLTRRQTYLSTSHSAVFTQNSLAAVIQSFLLHMIHTPTQLVLSLFWFLSMCAHFVSHQHFCKTKKHLKGEPFC